MDSRYCDRCGSAGTLVTVYGWGTLCAHCHYHCDKTFKLSKPSKEVFLALRDCLNTYPQYTTKDPIALSALIYAAGFMDRRPSSSTVEAALEALMGTERDRMLS